MRELVAFVYAIYSLLAPWLGRAGATGAMFLAHRPCHGDGAAVLFGMLRKTAPPPKPETAPLDSLVDRLSGAVRERPIAALSAAVGVGVLAIRNPRYLGAALRSMAKPKPD